MGTVDDYLSGLDAGDREVIAHVYSVVAQEVPEAEQGKGYGMPALVYRGKPLIAVMRASRHIGVYPFSPDAVAAVAADVRAVEGSGLDKGTVRFQPGNPLPDAVVRTLARTRREQIDG